MCVYVLCVYVLCVYEVYYAVCISRQCVCNFFTVFGLSGNGYVDGGRSTWKFPFALNLVSKSLVPKILTLVTVSIFSS